MKRILILFLISHLALQSDEGGYIFGWSHLDDPMLKAPRGGTTLGPDVKLDKNSSPYWEKLKDNNLSKFEKDRLAILSMQGEYRIFFDFMETMGFVPDYVPKQPYQSWGTEFVVLVEDSKDFISLQHIMVMYFEQDDGKVSLPIVVKHWRQDWKYQDNEINAYVGNNTWEKKRPLWAEKKGAWSQSVYQVDDSPRYQGYGKWDHADNFSSWTSNETWRPLPRREASIRDDYDVMIGTNIQTITPDGWVHEQNNKKVVLGDSKKVIAKEIGLARYQRVDDFDWDAGKEFWETTYPFWEEVRSQWDKKLNTSKTFKLKKEVNGANPFVRLFELSNKYQNGDLDSINKIQKIVEEHSETS